MVQPQGNISPYPYLRISSRPQCPHQYNQELSLIISHEPHSSNHQTNIKHQEIRQHYNTIWKIPRKKLLSYWYYFWGTTFWKKSLLWYVLKTPSEPTIIWETWGHWKKQKLAYSSTLAAPPSYIKMNSVFVYVFQFIIFSLPHPQKY